MPNRTNQNGKVLPKGIDYEFHSIIERMDKPDGLDAATTMQAMQHHTDGCLIVFCACQVHTEGTGASLSVGGAPFPVCEVELTRPLQDKMLFPKAIQGLRSGGGSRS